MRVGLYECLGCFARVFGEQHRRIKNAIAVQRYGMPSESRPLCSVIGRQRLPEKFVCWYLQKLTQPGLEAHIAR
jgi:hypothetical protein